MPSEHTPGPWIVCTVEDEPWNVSIEQDRDALPEDAEPSTIGEVYLQGEGVDAEIGNANARLIAAAPDLLAVVEHIEGMADDAYLSGHPEWVAIVEEARAALSRVKP